MGLREVTALGTALCLWFVSQKVPRPEARNCLRLVLSLSFIALLLSDCHHAIRQNEASILGEGREELRLLMFLALGGIDFNGALVGWQTLREDECSEANLYVRAVNLAERGGRS